jgi:hypothetical protein
MTKGASKKRLVGAVGNDRFLEDELQHVGKALPKAPGRHIGAAPQLHRRPYLAIRVEDIATKIKSTTSSTTLYERQQQGPVQAKSVIGFTRCLARETSASAEHSAITAEARAIGLVK